MQGKGYAIAELKDFLNELDEKEWKFERTIQYSNYMRDIIQRFIYEFEKEESSEEDLILMVDIVAHVWGKKSSELYELSNSLQDTKEDAYEKFEKKHSSEEESEENLIHIKEDYEVLVQYSKQYNKQSSELERLGELMLYFTIRVLHMFEASHYFGMWRDLGSGIDGIAAELNMDVEDFSDMDFEELEELCEKAGLDIYDYMPDEDDEDSIDNCVEGYCGDIFDLFFEYPVPHRLFEKVEEWFGEQKELDEIMGRV